MKRVYLVRHGESVGNRDNFLGGKDLELSESGQLQAAQLAERLMNLDVDKLVVSDYVRAQQTMVPTASAKKLEPEIVSAFGEMIEPSHYFGLADDAEEIEQFRNERNANIENPDFDAEDGENFFALQNRVNQARQYLEELESQSVLVVAHAYYICYFIACILLDTKEPKKETLALALRLNMDNTGISYLRFKDEQWRLMLHNDHAHFAE